MKVLITGAHFTPAVAVIEDLKKQPDIDVVYVGRKTTQEGDFSPSAESKILPILGVKFISITTGRLQRSFTLYTIPSLLKIPIGFVQAFFIILNERPDVILSFGGYVAVPIVLVGWLFSIPIIVHEQTLVSGLANKISSFFADKIALSFSSEKQKMEDRFIITGNPIRKEILEAARLSKKRSSKKTILITGGNQGSHIINLAVEQILGQLVKDFDVIHVTGENKFSDFERLDKLRISKNYQESYIVKKWIEKDWGEILRKVDLVISRAGINTLSELAYLGIPTLVIPIPYLYQDEQNKNAKYFEKKGLVKIISQSNLTSEELLKAIKDSFSNMEDFNRNAKKAREVIIPDAAKRLALETMLLATR